MPAAAAAEAADAAALHTGLCHLIGSISSDIIGLTHSIRFLSIQKATLHLSRLVIGSLDM